MLNTELMQRLKTIANAGSFTKAADKIIISSSALVQQVKALEKEIGFDIFQRGIKGVLLTPAGELFLERGDVLFQEYDTLLQKCLAMTDRNQDAIIIGSLPNLRPISILSLCRKYQKVFPQVRIQFKEFPLHKYFDAFNAHSFDITSEYICSYHHDNDIEFLPLKPTSYCIEVSKDDALAKNKSISFSYLRGRKLMLYNRGITKCDDNLRDYIEKHEPDITLIDIASYDSSLTIRAELENAVILTYQRYEPNFYPLVPIPLKTDFKIQLGIGYRKNCRPTVKDFLFEAAKFIKQENI